MSSANTPEGLARLHARALSGLALKALGEAERLILARVRMGGTRRRLGDGS